MTTPEDSTGGPGRPTPTSPSLIGSLASLARAMALSVWQAMRGRPSFLHIADTPFYWRVHVAMYVMLKLVMANFESLPWWLVVVFTCLGSGAVVLAVHFFFKAKNGSTVLAANLLATYVGWEAVSKLILAVVEAFGELSPAVESTVFALFTVAMFLSVISIHRHFYAMPSAVRKAGYEPTRENDFTWSRHD